MKLRAIPGTLDGLLSLLPPEDEAALRLLEGPKLFLRVDLDPKGSGRSRLAAFREGDPSRELLSAKVHFMEGAGEADALVLDFRTTRHLEELLQWRPL